MAAAIMPNGQLRRPVHNQAGHQHIHTFTFLTQHILKRHFTLNKNQLSCLDAYPAYPAFANTEARHIFSIRKAVMPLDRPPYLSWHKPPEWTHRVNL